MGIKTFAAIDVGSYEVSMKIFEISKKYGVHEIDYIRHRIDLGTETYNTGHISYERMDELCEILNGYTEIMKSYRVDDYKAYGTSAIRETVNTKIVVDQIKLRTGLNIDVLSNSEQRFLDYKSIALKSKYFSDIISAGTAIIDIGGGSTQVSLFDDAKLVCTVNLPLGILKLRSRIELLQPGHLEYEEILSELVDNELHNLRKIYLSEMDIRNIIVVDDYLSTIALKAADNAVDCGYVTGARFLEFVEILKKMPQDQAAKTFGIKRENASLLMPSAILVNNFIRITAAEKLWIPGVSLADGIAYDYAERAKIIKSEHDFTSDIISCAENISLRYKGSRSVGDELEAGALA
nr:exopolyphosphatase [Lachnospiraceae bacterium]